MIKSQAHQLALVLKAILELARVGSEEKGREVYLHTIPHSLSEYKADKRQHLENTKFGDFLTVAESGVIFQPYSHVFNYNFLLNFFFFFFNGIETILEANKEKVINCLLPEEKLSKEQFSIKFTIFSNNT